MVKVFSLQEWKDPPIFYIITPVTSVEWHGVAVSPCHNFVLLWVDHGPIQDQPMKCIFFPRWPLQLSFFHPPIQLNAVFLQDMFISSVGCRQIEPAKTKSDCQQERRIGTRLSREVLPHKSWYAVFWTSVAIVVEAALQCVNCVFLKQHCISNICRCNVLNLKSKQKYGIFKN